MDLQFFPTSPTLARKAFAKFKNNSVTRFLDPEAGRGDLLAVIDEWFGHRHSRPTIDCIELNLDNQAILRSKGYRVVAHDFLSYQGAALYSHIIMNPPFAQGVHHVLHAWNLLFHGELVAIVNAETIRNPFSKERRLLVDLIDQHGSVEFLADAFLSPDTQRKTEVEIALIHLEKQANFKANFLDDLLRDTQRERHQEEAIEAPQELVVPQSHIENLVTAFDCAVKAAREAVFAQTRADYYANMLGRSIVDAEPKAVDDSPLLAGAFKDMNERYQLLKERAWSSILRSTDVLDRLSSSAQKRVEAEFKTICELEFTVSNIRGFLCGLAGQQGALQIDMVCDVFDMISKYHPENRVYYQGWKSNAKHPVNAFRVLMNRFILPACRRDYYEYSFCSGLSWEDSQWFRDFDKVFAMLDGKHHDAPYGLIKLFHEHFPALRRGQRLSCDYFDVRFYAKAGTFHLFPRRKDLIDRLNRLVGQHRAWLPQSAAEASAEFWTQYEQAEVINRKMELRNFDAWYLLHGEEHEKARESQKLLASHTVAMEKLGIHYDASRALAEPAPAQAPLLLEAC